ncbi:MAG TPA: hypothetical protein PLL69_00540 [Gemmatimonadales bacterium]|nr:hypothetical protein [Gemmatimonadales bacterium]
MSWPKGSAMPALVVVELLGPLLQGPDPIATVLREALEAEGLELRPGALEQAQGMALRPALERLLEGHGRQELLDEVDRIEALARGRLASRRKTGMLRAASGASEGWQRLQESGSRLAVITNLPADLATGLAAAAGIAVESWQWIVADDGRGFPHPDHLLEWFDGRVTPDQVAAMVASAAAASAATSAGCGSVVAVGNGGAAMLADTVIEGLEKA